MRCVEQNISTKISAIQKPVQPVLPVSPVEPEESRRSIVLEAFSEEEDNLPVSLAEPEKYVPGLPESPPEPDFFGFEWPEKTPSQRPTDCIECGKTFVKRCNMVWHCKRVHNVVPPPTPTPAKRKLYCYTCGAICKNKSLLARHNVRRILDLEVVEEEWDVAQ